MRLAALVAVLVLVGAARPGAARADDNFIPPIPADFDQVDVYLLTVGRGPQPYALFGHTILRVVDRQRHLDMSFNWGIFDFEDVSFVWKFYVGDLDYQMAISDFQPLIDHYRDYERRSVVQERVVLTAKQKATLFKRLVWNSQPANIFYKYSQFYNNCATKVRDYLDEAVGGHIKESYFEAPSRFVFRDHIRAGADAQWWVYLGLDMASNSLLDAPLTAWDEMFLPAALRSRLRDLPAVDDDGNPIPGHNLLEDTITIVDRPEPHTGRSPYAVAATFFGLPLALVALRLIRVRAAYQAPSGRLCVAFGGLGLLFALWAAFWGAILPFSWVFSHYQELKHNAYQLLFWPVDGVFVVYAARVIWRRRLAPLDGGFGRLIQVLAALHLAALALAIVLWLVGTIRQDLLFGLGSFGLIAALFYGAVLWSGRAGEP